MKTHLSASFFNSMHNYCQAKKMAEEKGLWHEMKSDPLLIGGYVDAHFSGTMDKFIEENESLMFKKGGKLYAKFEHANRIIKVGESDPVFMKYMDGEKQKKVEGKISGVKYTGYLDAFHPDKCITELKVVKSIRETEYDHELGYRVNFIQKNGYLRQLAIYRELVRQMTDKVLPCYILALSKEAAIDKEVIFIPSFFLDMALDEVKEYSQEYLNIRQGDQEPKRCGKCNYCRSTRLISKPLNYEHLTT